ncbi:MAG: beta strand repeat-containing protein, partial [Longimicrobiales bacterium]
MRRWVALALIPLASVCVDGVAPLFNGPALQLALLPTLADGLPAEGSLPINRVRITALLAPGGDTLAVIEQDVEPAAASWTLTFEVPVREDLVNPSFYVILELINASQAGQVVQWSGRSATMPLALTQIPEIREVPVVRGPVANLDVTEVVIAEHAPDLLEGDSVALSAVATSSAAGGTPVVYWATADPTVVSVSSSGRVRGVGPGSGRVVAIAGPKADTTTLLVAPRPVAVSLTPDSIHLRSLEEEAKLTAAVVDARGQPVAGESVRWAVDDSTVVRNMGDGVFRAMAPGRATVSAQSVNQPAFTATATLLVAPVPKRIEISPAEAYLARAGEEAAFHASGWDANGHPAPGATYAWASLNPAAATVDSRGVVTAVGSGVARIVASTELGADTVVVTVGMNLTTVAVTPAELTFTTMGRGAQLTAAALASDGAPITTITRFQWASDNPAVARVDAEGYVTSAGDGTARVTAQVGGVQGAATIRVARTVKSVTVAPASHTLVRFGETVQLVAQARDSADVPVTAPAAWTSSSPGVATVTPAGVVSAVSNGQTTVEVLMGGVSATALVSVDLPAPTVSIAPDTLVLAALGASASVEARVRDDSGAPAGETSFAWEATPPETIAIDPSGPGTAVVSALQEGTGRVTVTVTRRGYTLSASAVVVVRQALDSVAVDPGAVTFVARGETQQFSARALDAAGRPMAQSPAVSWSSSDPRVVTVSATGLATAVDDGIAFIQAAVAGIQGRAAVTVARKGAGVTVLPEDLPTLTSVGAKLQLSALVVDGRGNPLEAAVAWRSVDTTVAKVDGSGLVTAVADGAVGIIASEGAFADTAHVVVRQAIAEIRLTPTSAGFNARGETRAFAATAFDAGGTLVRSVSTFTWTTSNALVATVAGDGTVTAVGDGEATITAAAGGAQAMATVTVGIEVARIEVVPATHTFASEGETVSLTATAFDAGGSPVVGVTTFAWRTSDPLVATVDASGVVMAVADGSAVISAQASGVTGTASVTVSRQAASVSILPASPAALAYLGQTLTLSATVRDALGAPMAVPVTWLSLAPGVATVDASGRVTAAATGAAGVVATASGKADTVTITVAQRVSYITVTPRSRTFTAGGETESFSAVAYDASGTPVSSVTSFTWSSTAPGVATVAPTAGASTTVTSVGTGSATVVASAGGVDGSATLKVSLQAASVTIAPSPPRTLTRLGETMALTATVRDILGGVVATPVTWMALDPSVATVSSSGLVTAVANGDGRVVATAGSVADTVTVPVAQAASYVTVTPGARTFSALGQTQQFTAAAFDAGGAPLSPAPAVAWSSSNGAVASVSSTGLATAVADGSATVKAAVVGAEGTVTVSVSRPIALIEVSPATATLTSKGATQAYTAVAKDAGGSVIGSVTSFTWSSSNNAVATVGSGTGLATAVGNGTATVTASTGGVSGTASLTVTRAVAEVVIAPASPGALTSIGGAVQLSAAVTDALGQAMGTSVTWTSLDAGVATVSAGGLVTAVSNGTARIVATSGGVSDTVTVTVSQAVASVVVTP